MYNANDAALSGSSQRQNTTSKMLWDVMPRVYDARLAMILGLNEAIVLQQLQYLIYSKETYEKNKPEKYREHCRTGFWWIDISNEQMQAEFPFLSASTIARVIGKLEKAGILVSSKFDSRHGDHTKWYRIDYVVLDTYRDDNPLPEEIPQPPADPGGDSALPLAAAPEPAADPVNLTESIPSKWQDRSCQNEGILNKESIKNLKTLNRKQTGACASAGKPPERARANPPAARKSWYSSENSNVGVSEYEREAIDEEGNPLNRKGKPGNQKWRQPTGNPLCQAAFAATHRQKFADRDERSAWIKIEKGALPLDSQGRVQYPLEWVHAMIAWARTMNAQAIRITFPRLISAINNEAKRHDFIVQHLGKLPVERDYADLSGHKQDKYTADPEDLMGPDFQAFLKTHIDGEETF